MDHQHLTTLFALLKAIPDPRKARGKRYSWVCLLAILCVGVLAGQHSGSAIVDWATFRSAEVLACLAPLLHRIPSASTLRRALRYIDIETLERVAAQFVRSLDGQDEVVGRILGTDGEPLRGQALDGKELRGASAHGDGAAPGGKLLLVSLVRHDSGATLAQTQVGPEGGESEAARQLLAVEDLRGTVTVMDALHTNRGMAQQIIDRGGDYLMIVKGNQPTLYVDIETFFQGPLLPGEDDRDTYSKENKGHGRLEKRTLTCSPGLSGYLDWPGAQQVAQRRCQRLEVKSGKSGDRTSYAITSLAAQRAGAPQLEALWREYWTIENKSHYVRDETMGEDRCQIHKGDAPRALATLRNVVVAALRYHGWTNIARAMRYYNAHAKEAFAFLGADAL